MPPLVEVGLQMVIAYAFGWAVGARVSWNNRSAITGLVVAVLLAILIGFPPAQTTLAGIMIGWAFKTVREPRRTPRVSESRAAARPPGPLSTATPDLVAMRRQMRADDQRGRRI